MKKKNRVYLGLFFVILLIIALVSVNKFNGDKEDLTGTIGKVEKYRKVQLTEKDVKLRNDLMTDTSEVSKSIKGLLVFHSFTIEFTKKTEEWKNSLKGNYSPELKNAISLADNYSKFIKDNSKTVEDALLFLLDVYNGDTTEASVNIEPKLKKFNDFVTELSKKDSMLVTVIPMIDKEIKGSTNSKTSKEVINELVNAKERFAVNSIPLSIIIGSKTLFNCFNNIVISNVANLKGLYYGKNDLGHQENAAIYTAKTLGLILFSQNQLNTLKAALQSQNLNMIPRCAKELYNSKSSLGFVDPVEANCLACGNVVLSNFSHFASSLIYSNSALKAGSLNSFLNQSALGTLIGNKMAAKLGKI